MRIVALLIAVFSCTGIFAQVKAPLPYGVLPSERQLKWHEVEMYVIVHFTPTTFEDKEWGFGDAAPEKKRRV